MDLGAVLAAFDDVFAREVASTNGTRVTLRISEPKGGPGSGVAADVSTTVTDAQDRVVTILTSRALVVPPGAIERDRCVAALRRSRARLEEEYGTGDFDHVPPTFVTRDELEAEPGPDAAVATDSEDALTELEVLLQIDAPWRAVNRYQTALASASHRAVASTVTARLRSALRRKDFWQRDVYAALLAGMLGADAIPILLEASAADLGDDQDSLAGILGDLFDRFPEARRT